jgi:hypothetical protein
LKHAPGRERLGRENVIQRGRGSVPGERAAGEVERMGTVINQLTPEIVVRGGGDFIETNWERRRHQHVGGGEFHRLNSTLVMPPTAVQFPASIFVPVTNAAFE